MRAALPNSDPVAAYPELALVREAVNKQDWSAIQRYYATLPSDSDRTLLPLVIIGQSDIEVELQRALKLFEDDPLLLALLGTYEVTTSWRSLGIRWNVPTATGSDGIGELQRAEFRRRLGLGEGLLLQAVALDPTCDIALAGLLRTSRGLHLGVDESRRRYDRLAEHNPAHYSGQCRMLQQLCPKWGGRWTLAHRFVDECRAGAPDGTLTGALAAELHIEHWKAGDTDYLHRTDVLQQLAEAAQRSVLHPAFRRVYPWVRAHGAFALAFAVSDAHRRAAPHFRALDNLIDANPPWGYLPDAPAQYAAFRAAALNEDSH
ncbi:hypothetical protein [Nocardia sp. NPDC005998]|uniref:hypothetical protein n=1 Tax=Nocardia sp. NPDC005998 TaxID=3156894 RepID=UPI0033B1F2C3